MAQPPAGIIAHEKTDDNSFPCPGCRRIAAPQKSEVDIAIWLVQNGSMGKLDFFFSNPVLETSRLTKSSLVPKFNNTGIKLFQISSI